MDSNSDPAATAHAPAYRLDWRSFLAIVCAFWAYAALSAVLYAWGMDVSLRAEVGKSLFADWPLRVLLYLVLLPPLVACYRISLWLGWQPLARRMSVQIMLGALFAALPWPIFMLILSVFEPGGDPKPASLAMLLATCLKDLPMWLASFTDFMVRYGFGLALVTGFAVYKRFRDIELRITALEQQWGAARLAALRMQLSPHTLFNLLHTIRGMIAWDPSAAQSMVVQLADLLRRLLSAGERDFSLLADELQFVRIYLDLQRRRFAERLSVELPVPGDLPPAWVPSLILQPLVENAVLHGMAGHDGPVTVTIEIASGVDELVIRVRNSMATHGVARAAGIGLRNVRERLAVQFGARGSLAAGREAAGSWLAEVRMPWLLQAPAAVVD